MGADPQIRTKQSLSILHMASQGESPYSFYLRDLIQRPKNLPEEDDALDVNIKDRNLCTPLHWAVYVSSPICISYLLAQPKIQINAKDVWGQTPLHKSVRKGDLRVIKQLLVKGADKNTKDAQGKTPLDLVEECFDLDDSDEFETQMQIKELFKPDGIMNELAMLRTPNKPLNKNNRIVRIYLFFIILTLAMNIVTAMANSQPITLMIIVIFLAVDFFIFLSVMMSSSSYIECSKQIQFVSLMETFDPETLCPFCQVIRLPQSRHCNICNRCVDRYDHHCLWVNN